MKKMKKLITLLISLTMIFALCACGQTAEPKTEEPAKTDAPAADVAAADEPVTLRLYTRYSDEDNIKRIDYAVEKLKDEYPNVTIEIEAMPAKELRPPVMAMMRQYLYASCMSGMVIRICALGLEQPSSSAASK